MAPIGEPLQSLLGAWRDLNPQVSLKIYEMSDRDLAIAIGERRLDVALLIDHMVWPHAQCLGLYAERLVAVLPEKHPLASAEFISWVALKREAILVQGWDESQAARDLYTSLLGGGADFRPHAASKLSLFALVAAGFGITLATASQSMLDLPGIVFRPIDEANARVEIALAWAPTLEDPTVGSFIAFLRDRAHLRLPL